MTTGLHHIGPISKLTVEFMKSDTHHNYMCCICSTNKNMFDSAKLEIYPIL